jgi:CRISPR-associated exonuclease Cas4
VGFDPFGTAVERKSADGRGPASAENADTETTEIRDGVRICRGLRIRSLRHGIAGRADVVEFGSDGPRPVEYKRGKPKSDDMDQAQLCAQALCLEEMLGVSIPEGSLVYGEPRRKTPVFFDQELRQRVESLIVRFMNWHAKRRSWWLGRSVNKWRFSIRFFKRR